jgi:hypothetical protein
MAMVGALISVDEYLHTVYRPDCDYVDGEVLERNMAEQPHSITQVEFLSISGSGSGNGARLFILSSAYR